MIDFSTFIPWLLLMFPLVYSPGPANILFASNGAAFGFSRTLPFMAGLDLAFLLQSFLVGLGIGEIVLRLPAAMLLLKLFGIAYIAYLGCLFLKAAAKPVSRAPRCLTFLDGMVCTALNPKAWVMQLMMFSQFLTPQADALPMVATLSAWLCALNVSGHAVWTLCGSALTASAGGRLSPRRQNLMFAAMIFGSLYFMV